MTSLLRSLPLTLVLLVAAFAAPAWSQTCGDDATEGDETCDDGNTVGGDGCAANCTEERRVTFAIVEGTRFNVQGALRLAYDPPGLSPRGTLTLTLGAPRSSEATGLVPFVVLADDVQVEPVTLLPPTCFCARPAVPPGFPDGIVAQGMLGCGAGGLPEVDYLLSRDHDIGDVDPGCTTGTLNDDGHCVGPLQRNFIGAAGRGAATAEIGFAFYELSNCDATPGDPDMQGCTADDPVSVPVQRLLLTTGVAEGEIFNADGGAARIGIGEECAGVPCVADAAGASFDCDALLGEPGSAGPAALGAVDVGVHFAGLPDIVTVLRLALDLPATPTPTVTATATASSTPTVTATAVETSTPTVTATDVATATPTEQAITPTEQATTPTEHAATTPTPTAGEATATAGEATATPTAPVASCAGDCNGDDAVDIAELIRGVSIALGALPISACPVFDSSGDDVVSVNELIQAVSAALSGCP